MAEVRCRPIDFWDGPYTYDLARRRPPFKASWQTMLDDLEREFDYLDAGDVVIGLDVRDGDIRLDGWPRAGAIVPPPVSLTLQTRHGPLRFQCDRWDTWRGNLRAIGLTLQRLRLVDEGGCTRSGEQYRGWNALPAGRPMSAAMTVEQAARLLADHSGQDGLLGYDDPDVVDAAWRRAARTAHPDVGGDPATFRQLTEARDLLKAHHV